MTGTDMIVFRKGAGVGDGQSWQKWPDPWPPPPRLCLVGTPDGTAICNPDAQDDEGKAMLRNASPGAVLWFHLTTASEIAEPAPEGEHWFRGAEYVPAKVTTV